LPTKAKPCVSKGILKLFFELKVILLQKLQLSWWSDLIKEYFTPKAVMKLTLWKDNQRNEAKPFGGCIGFVNIITQL